MIRRGSGKRARDEEPLNRSTRFKYAESEEPTINVLSPNMEAIERVKSAARSVKRPRTQTQAATDSRAVCKKDTSALQQVSVYSLCLLGLP